MRVLDLFSGIGGFSLGLERAGMETVAFCEIEEYPRKVLKKHWPEVPIYKDVRKLDRSLLIEDGIIQYPDNCVRVYDMSGKLKVLSEDQVLQSIDLYNSGFSYQEIGELWGVSRQSMWELLKTRGVKSRPKLKYGKDNHFYRGGKVSDPYVWSITDKAILRGRLIPEPCEVCGANGTMADGRNEVQAHHDDYNKPLDVRWLCQKDHYEWHKTNKPISRMEPEPTSGVDVLCGGFP